MKKELNIWVQIFIALLALPWVLLGVRWYMNWVWVFVKGIGG